MNKINVNSSADIYSKKEPMQNKNIKEFISKFDIVSFDVFDTLLFRKTSHPDGVFYYIENETQDKGFAQRRIDAEEISRKINITRYNSSETTISDIYRVLYEDPEQQKIGIEREIRSENHFLTAYKRNKEIYDIARSLNKKIIAVSDMYMPEEHIKAFLEYNGIFVDKVFCSSTYYKNNLCKGNGGIYPIVCQEMNVLPSDIIHFGDNYNSDLVQAISSGISAVQTPTILHELFNDSRFNLHTIYLIDTKKSFESKIILGLLANRHSEGYFDKDPTIKMFGYIYSGILMVSFIKNILDISKKKNIKKLLLMTRDGFIVKKAMSALKVSNIEYEIFWSSRRMCLVPLLGLPTQWNWVFPILFPYREDNSYSLKSDMDRLHLKFPADFTNIETNEHNVYIEKLKMLGSSWWSQLVKDEYDSYMNYLKNTIGDTPLSEVAFVDVGWGLSSHRAIDVLLGKKIPGFYVGTHQRSYANSNIHGILFQEGKPVELNEAIMGGAELIELMFSDSSPSAIWIKENGKEYYPILESRDAADTSRDWYVNEIQHCMMDFISDISSYFPILSADILRDISAECMVNIITNPNQNEQEILGKIPHAREVGHGNFRPISYWWHPRKPNTPSPSDPHANLTQARKESFALHGRVLPRSEMVARKILNPIVGAKRADWLIKTWNSNKRKIKSKLNLALQLQF